MLKLFHHRVLQFDAFYHIPSLLYIDVFGCVQNLKVTLDFSYLLTGFYYLVVCNQSLVLSLPSFISVTIGRLHVLEKPDKKEPYIWHTLHIGL